MGRAMFYGKRLLLEQEHGAVRVMMPWRDWDAVRASSSLMLLLHLDFLRRVAASSRATAPVPLIASERTLPWSADVSEEITLRPLGSRGGRSQQVQLAFHRLPTDHLGERVASIQGLVWAQGADPLAPRVRSKKNLKRSWSLFCAHGRAGTLCEEPDCGWTLVSPRR